MSLSKKPPKNSVSIQLPFVDGPTLLKSNLSSPKVAIEDSILETTLRTTNLKSSIVASLPLNKKMTLKDKSNSHKKNSPHIKYIPMSEVASTLNDPVSSPFSNKSFRDLSGKLWLPPKTDSPDLISNSLNGFLNSSIVNSQLLTMKKLLPPNKSFLKTFYRSSLFTQPDITENANIKSKKIRFYPNPEQIELFNKCFSANRYIYNNCVSHSNILYDFTKKYNRSLAKKSGCIHIIKNIGGRKKSNLNRKKDPILKQCKQKLHNDLFCKKHEKSKENIGTPTQFIYWRNLIVRSENQLKYHSEEWLKEIPYDTRQLAVKNFSGGLKSCLTNLSRGHIDKFGLTYKSKKSRNQIFHVDHRAIKVKDSIVQIFKQKLKAPELEINKRDKKWLINLHNKEGFKDMIIKRESPGRYYLLVPYEYNKIKNNKTDTIVSIDPGVRTFHTFYDPIGKVGEIGNKFAELLIKDRKKQDKLRSIIDSTKLSIKNRKKYTIKNIKRKIEKISYKIKNKLKDLHDKTIKYYCENYNNIVIPKLDIKSLTKRVKKDYGGHSKKSKNMIRNMKCLSHGEFIERLRTKASSMKNVRVHIVSEEYTSKCGILNGKLGSSKIFDCGNCGISIDRDVNGARNILLKNIC